MAASDRASVGDVSSFWPGHRWRPSAGRARRWPPGCWWPAGSIPPPAWPMAVGPRVHGPPPPRRPGRRRRWWTEAHEAGLAVAAWTVNDRADLRSAWRPGVDTVITDDVTLALPGRRRRATEPVDRLGRTPGTECLTWDGGPIGRRGRFSSTMHGHERRRLCEADPRSRRPAGSRSGDKEPGPGGKAHPGRLRRLRRRDGPPAGRCRRRAARSPWCRWPPTARPPACAPRWPWVRPRPS